MPFVLSAGSIDRVRPAANAFGFGLPSYVRLGANDYRSYEQLYKAQPALRTVIEFLARNIAELPLDTFTKSSDNDRNKVLDHPLAKLLDDPWPGSKWTKYRLINWTVQEYCLYHSAFWIKGQAPDGSRGVLPIPRRYIEPIGDNLFFPDAYRLTGTKG